MRVCWEGINSYLIKKEEKSEKRGEESGGRIRLCVSVCGCVSCARIHIHSFFFSTSSYSVLFCTFLGGGVKQYRKRKVIVSKLEGLKRKREKGRKGSLSIRARSMLPRLFWWCGMGRGRECIMNTTDCVVLWVRFFVFSFRSARSPSLLHSILFSLPPFSLICRSLQSFSSLLPSPMSRENSNAVWQARRSLEKQADTHQRRGERERENRRPQRGVVAHTHTHTKNKENVSLERVYCYKRKKINRTHFSFREYCFLRSLCMKANGKRRVKKKKGKERSLRLILSFFRVKVFF